MDTTGPTTSGRALRFAGEEVPAVRPAHEDDADTHVAGYVSLASRRAGDFYRALGYEDSAVFFRKTLRGR